MSAHAGAPGAPPRRRPKRASRAWFVCAALFLFETAMAAPRPDAGSVFGPTVSREELVGVVLERNPAVEAATSAVDAAAARIRASGAWPEPRVSGSLAPLSVGGHETGWGIELSQTLPLSGRPGLERAAARVRATISEHDLAATRIELARTASDLFDDWWLVERAIALNATHRERLHELERSVRDRYVVGRTPEASVLAAELERLQLERQAIELQARSEALVSALNALMHREVDAPLPPPEPPSRPANLVASTEPTHDRPDVEALAARQELADIEERMARRAWTPDPMLMTEYSNMWPHEEHRWMVGVGVDIPLSVRARNAAIDAARAERAAASSRLARAIDAASDEQRRAWLEADAARRSWELLAQRVVPVAEQRTTASRIAFEADRTDFRELIEAERALLEAELAAHSALADHHRALAAFAAARGELPGALP